MPLLSSTQLHSNFELNSKLPNFTRDSFQTWADMVNVNPLYMDEGHISYCEQYGKHYIYSTVDGQANWAEFNPNKVLVIETKSEVDDSQAEALELGSLVYCKENDTLYFKTYHYIENQSDINGYLCPIPKINEVADNYLSKTDAAATYLTIQTATDRYLQKNDAQNTYQTIQDTRDNYLTKTNASDTYLQKNVAQKTYQTIQDTRDNYLTKTDASSTYLTKTSAENTYLTHREAQEDYAKKVDIQQLIDGYVSNYPDAFVGVDIAEGLHGLRGVDISHMEYSINEILDKILFKEWIPERTLPSLDIDFKLKDWNNKYSWYDEPNKVLLLKNGSTAPQQYFIGINIKNSQFTTLSGSTFNHTNGINTNEQNAPNSKVVCKIQNGGVWEALANLPSTFSSPGEYRYYYDARFKPGQVILNNRNEEKVNWNVHTAIESNNYITINVSKPTKKNTQNGLVENPILYWKDEMEDYFTLEATCLVEQKFQTPREAKKIYVWNDLCGYAEDLSFTKSQKSDGYYEYTYDHAKKGHRGKIKIKVVF